MKNRTELLVMILPTAVLFFIFLYLPMFGLVLAFREYDVIGGLMGHSWAGLKYFKQFFADPYCFRIIRNTVMLNLYMLVFAFPASIIFTLIVNEVKQKSIRKTYQTISYLPHFVSTVIIVGIMFDMFSSRGVVNQAMNLFGIKNQLFFQNANMFRPLYVGSSIWDGLGWNSIVYFAALAAINPELYECASIEGAGRFAKIIHVTIPGILPTIVIMFILTVGSLFTVAFEKVLLMYNPGVYEKADVIATYVYRRGILGMDYSYSTAVGMFNSVANFILLLGANYLSRKAGHGLW